jgi:hypothetical protein
MASLLDNFAIRYHENDIRVHDSRQAVAVTVSVEEKTL